MKEKLKIYSVSDKYISYLRQDEILYNVLDNKEDTRIHTRKYLGVALVKNGFNYFIPFSSPKNKDYFIDKDGKRKIRKSVIPIIRMTTLDTVTGEMELKGTLRLSNMIPVPDSELIPYVFSGETDENYKMIVLKEYDFIKSNEGLIRKYASIIYNQKTKFNIYYPNPNKAPDYLNNTVDFLYAEFKCLAYGSVDTVEETTLK